MTDLHSTYTSLLMRHRDMLWRMCWNRVDGDRERCKDLLQEVSIALWENIEKLRPDATPGQERAWVRWQARSVFYQIERRHKVSTMPIQDNLLNSSANEEAQSHKEILEDLLSTLNPDDKQMLCLYLEGYQGDEIGEKIGVSRNVVYQRMRRLIVKMRKVVLILLALVLTSTIAIAVVPEWRQLIFGNRSEEKVIDTIPTPTKPEPIATHLDTTPNSTISKRKKEFKKMESLEPMPPLDILCLNHFPDTVSPIRIDDIPTLSVDGMTLTITGATGEHIRVYNNSGKLVAHQIAGSICIIDLFPCTESLSCSRRNRFILQIGNRNALELNL